MSREQSTVVRELLSEALQQHQAGRIEQAEQAYRQILAIDEAHSDSLHMLGMIAYQLGHPAAAANLIQRAIEMNGTEAIYHYSLGRILQTQGKLDEAVARYERALALRPDLAGVHCALGTVLEISGRLDEAVAWYERALALKPNYADAHYCLANLLRLQGKLHEAVTKYESALAIHPGHVLACSNLGTVLETMGKLDEAVARYEQALALRPDLAEVHVNLGNVLQAQGKLDEAVARYEQALVLKPDYADAHSNLGNVLQAQGKLSEALEQYERALVLRPDYVDAHMNRSQAQLLSGNFVSGWRNYEWRWRWDKFPSPKRRFVQPQWHGEPLNGARILLHAEQGLGDTIQFLRYVPLVRAAGGTLLLEIPAGLRRIAASMPGIADLLVFGEALPHFDWHCPLMSLPLAFGTTLDTIPAQVPYLSIPPAARPVASSLSWPADGLRVGLCWAGNPMHHRDQFRSFSLSLFAMLAYIEGVHLFSLQMGSPAAQLGGSNAYITDLAPFTSDMADTAAQIEHLDVIISVDTSVAHLAGALGKPLWLLLSYFPDWRWLLDRENSPWYPTARLFRQAALGDWQGIMNRVACSLSQLAAEHTPLLHCH